MKSVAFHNLGCKVNSYELDVVQQKFVESGYTIVPFDQQADIYIINTCTVTNIADRKSRQMLHQAKARNEKALVVALGCYVQTDTEGVQMDPAIDIAIGNNLKKDTLEIVEAYLAEKSPSYSLDDAAAASEKTSAHHMNLIDINHTDEYEEMKLEKTSEHTRAYIKIQDGCNQFCTYCIIPFARGRVRSRKQEDILTEITELVAKGYKEFVLTGIHIGSYGLDFDGKHYNASDKDGDTYLLQLIKAIHAVDGVERIRLGSLEPQMITEYFVKNLVDLPKVCPHFHLSLQSGCDETLKRMNRQYTTEDFQKSCELLRAYLDNPAITTDVITGFPGETEEEFAKTRDFVEKIDFFEMHIFPYSVRKGTVAAGMQDQLTNDVKKQRSQVLLALDEELSMAYRQRFLGQMEEVLLEEAKTIDGKDYMIGHTKRYVKVAVSLEELRKYKDLDNYQNLLVRGQIGQEMVDNIVFLGKIM